MRALLAFAATLFLCMAPMAVAGQDSTAASNLRLRPGDAIRLEVFPRLAAVPQVADGRTALEFVVDHRGLALFPVAGLVQVSGRPFTEVEYEVRRAFEAEFTDARVRLVPLLRIAVLGEVRLPGLLPVDPTMSFSDVLAAAGGLTESADRGDVRLVRGDTTLVRLSADDLLGLGQPLRSGDRVVVGRRSWAAENLPFLIGAGASMVASVLTALLVR